MTKATIPNATHYFITEISNQQSLWEIASNHSIDIDFKCFMKICIE